ncbi:MAG TPA: FRG domain-containing protein [Candidatus Acidoferrum sp.]|jgi:hypothetical protein|nr:FRG domain-containing protein [Candidatus Acidoferrum sp.]
MKEIPVSSFLELHQALQGCRNNPLWIFRGQSDVSWKLIPKAGRSPFNRVEDDALFYSWKSDAIQYIADKPRTELEWLAIAQHHGLATRLLDWTRNPLVAAFFAVWENANTDAALFAFFSCEIVAADYDASPFYSETKRNVFVWGPDAISPRIIRQQGIFTVHEPAKTPLYILKGMDELICLRIDKNYRQKLREELAHYGITRATLFPDLEGLANYHNWKIHYEFPNFRQAT